MKKRSCLLSALLLVGALATVAVAGETLDAVKKKGVLVAGVKDSTPPFGFTNRESGEIVGLEVDLLKAVAKKLGVELKLKPVSSSNRIPSLLEGDVDIVAATMSKTPDRALLVGLSNGYMRTGQMFLAKAGAVKTLKDLEGKKIAAVKGSTSGPGAKRAVPSAQIELFDDLLQAGSALKRGEVDAMTTDGGVLGGLLSMAKEKGKYEIPDIRISEDEYVMAVRKGDKELLDVVNGVLKEQAADGGITKLFDKWVASLKEGPKSSAGKAGGVIFRGTGTPNRFMTMALKGTFHIGSDVSVFDSEGTFVCKGVVKSIYTDEVYIDVDAAKAQSVEVGFAVGANVSNEEAKQIVLSRQDVLKNVKAESKKATEQQQKEVAAEYRKDVEERRQWQEKMTEEKMQLDYQYNDDNRWYNGTVFYAW